MKKKYKWLLAVLILLISGSAYAYSVMKPVLVEAETVTVSDLTSTFTARGTLVPEYSTVINAGTGGQVLELTGKAGELISKGTVLARIGGGGQTSLELQREQYRQQLTSAKQQYDSMFGAGGLAAAAQKAAESQYQLLEKQYKNARTLAVQGGFISQSELDSAKAQLDGAWQQVLKAREENSDSSRKSYEDLIDSYERQLEMMEGTVKEETIEMPYDGILWTQFCSTGEFVMQNDPVIKIYQPGNFKMKASLLAEDAVLLNVGEPVEVTFADKTVTEETITFISQVAEQSLSTIGMEENRSTVELSAVQLPEGIGAGYQADLSFTLTAAKGVYSVPVSAIVPTGEQDSVYGISNGKAVLIPVETGVKSGGRIEIRSGLVSGDVVLTDPYGDSVKAGSRVSAK